MSSVRKGTLTHLSEWWKHLRPYNKRKLWKAERQATKKLITKESRCIIL